VLRRNRSTRCRDDDNARQRWRRSKHDAIAQAQLSERDLPRGTVCGSAFATMLCLHRKVGGADRA
jgi:hypothetical protein